MAQLFNAALCLCGGEGTAVGRGLSNRGRVSQLKSTSCLDLLCSVNDQQLRCVKCSTVAFFCMPYK